MKSERYFQPVPAEVFPPLAVGILLLAAREAHDVADPQERAQLIDSAVRRVQHKYPRFFKE